MPITATHTFIEAIEMQECARTKIQDDIYQCSKDELFAKVDFPTPTSQPNHTCLKIWSTTIKKIKITVHNNSHLGVIHLDNLYGTLITTSPVLIFCNLVRSCEQASEENKSIMLMYLPKQILWRTQQLRCCHRNTLLVDNVNTPYKLLLSFPFQTKGNIIPNTGKNLNELGSGDSNTIHITEDSFMKSMNGVQSTITNVDMVSILPDHHISKNVAKLCLKW